MALDPGLAAEFGDLGVELPAGMAPARAAEGFEVLPQAWDALRAFLDCETQWRVAAGFGGVIWLGLDYAAVEIVLRRKRLADGVFDDLQVMERAALDVFSEGDG